MASIAVTQAAHKTLSGTTVDTVTLGKRFHSILITNYDTTNRLYVTFDGTTPTAAGDNTYAVPAASAKRFRFVTTVLVVKIIGNGGAYDVEGF